ncbi:MAG: FAD-dependent oxidoreductase [Alphaproteobacteria bacterium]|nr:FAD-dependent oxidoreductase [Alphaproteobacteria bacterium]
MDTPSSADVIIVGGGIAGLTAAIELAQKSRSANRTLSILIVEADSVAGGRARSVLHQGVTLNPGANWFHGGAENPLFRWACGRYGTLAAHNDDGNNSFCVKDGQVLGDAYFRKNLDALEAAYQRFKATSPEKDLSLAAIADMAGRDEAKEAAEFLARNWMAVNGAADVSADEFFAEPCTEEKHTKQLAGGTAQLITLMLQELKKYNVRILTGRAISTIEQSAAGVRMTDTQGREYAGARAIVTLPPGVLQKGAVRFDPPLSEDTQKYIDDITVAHLAKIIVPVKEAFFTERGIKPDTYIEILDNQASLFCHAYGAGKPVIALVAGGKDALRIEKMSEPEILRFVEQMFRLAPALKDYQPYVTGKPYVTDWSVNPLSLGSYSALKVGHRRQDPASEGRVVLCGEAFIGGSDPKASAGTMVGAWHSGQAAAQKVFADLLPFLAQKNLPPAQKPPKMG